MDADHFSSLSRYHRRTLIVLVAISSIALGAIYFVLPQSPLSEHSSKLAQDFVAKLLATILGTSVAAGALIWFIPEQYRTPVVRVVYPHDVKGVLRDALEGATEFQFCGQTGGWTRAITLPVLAEMVSRKGLQVNVTLVLIDPRNTALCTRYATYRSSTKNKKAPGSVSFAPVFEWTAQATRLELLSTIIAAYCWTRQEPRLQIRVGLSSQFSVFRVDLTDKSAVLTQEDLRLPALEFPRDSCHYASIRMDVQQKFSQSFVLPAIQNIPLLENLECESVQVMLAELNLDDSAFTPEEYEYLAKTAASPRNPYEL